MYRYAVFCTLIVLISHSAGCSSTQRPPIRSEVQDLHSTPSIGEIVSLRGDQYNLNVGTRDGLVEGAYCYIHRDDYLVGVGLVTQVRFKDATIDWMYQQDELIPQEGDRTKWLYDWDPSAKPVGPT